MTIGELAKHAGVRASTIRYYERLGLVPAAPRRSGWRDFDGNALAHLTVVQFAVKCGFSLKEAAQLVEGLSTRTTMSERWNALAEHKIAEMDAAIERGRTMKRLLMRIRRCRCGTSAECGHRMLRKRA
jgi:MerR family transcriptional regulator, redox-sensitive transcriptional activator SoxR